LKHGLLSSTHRTPPSFTATCQHSDLLHFPGFFRHSHTSYARTISCCRSLRLLLPSVDRAVVDHRTTSIWQTFHCALKRSAALFTFRRTFTILPPGTSLTAGIQNLVCGRCVIKRASRHTTCLSADAHLPGALRTRSGAQATAVGLVDAKQVAFAHDARSYARYGCDVRMAAPAWLLTSRLNSTHFSGLPRSRTLAERHNVRHRRAIFAAAACWHHARSTLLRCAP